MLIANINRFSLKKIVNYHEALRSIGGKYLGANNLERSHVYAQCHVARNENSVENIYVEIDFSLEASFTSTSYSSNPIKNLIASCKCR